MEMTLPTIKVLEATPTYGRFEVEPLDRGYGATLGSPLRRVLLSSIPGAAITYIKIDKVQHEFSTIPGVKEDTTELMLNLKNVHVKVLGDGAAEDGPESRTLTLEVKGPGAVTGADIKCPSDVEVVNPEVYLATISDKGATLSIEMTVDIGKGYVAPDKLERRSQMPIGTIPMGAAFTPVQRVNYTVEATRVQSNINLERLVVEVTTNGTMGPEEAMNEAAAILMRYFGLFAGARAREADLVLLEGGLQGYEADTSVPNIRIEELDFQVRTYNCLKKANILTVPELVTHSANELMEIRNFGRKSLDEVADKLKDMGLSLRGGSIADEIADEEPEGEDADASLADASQLKDKPLADLGLASRAYDALTNANVTTIRQLAAMSSDDLLNLLSPPLVKQVHTKLAKAEKVDSASE